MRFFIDFGQLVDDVRAGVKEVNTFVKETNHEISEVMTDGFVEIVIKKNSNYLTSSEKRDKAYSLINKAKKKLENRVTDLQACAQQTEKNVEDFYNYRSDTFEKILKSTSEYLSVFNQIGSKSRLPTEKTLLSQNFFIDNSEKFSEFTFNTILVKATLPPTIINLIEQKHRVEKADSFLEEAKDYDLKIETEIAKLNLMESKLKYIHQIIDEEKTLLNRLYEKANSTILVLRKINNEAQETLEDADKIIELNHIIELLKESMEMVFITKSLNINSEYKKKMKLIQFYI